MPYTIPFSLLIPRCRLARGIVGPDGRYFKRRERASANRSVTDLADAALDDVGDAELAPEHRNVDCLAFEDDRRSPPLTRTGALQ